MIEKTSIKLSETFMHAIQNVQESGKELLISELLNSTTAIEKMITAYYYESRGKIDNINLEEKSIVFENNLKGSLTFNFSISYFMGCQDLTYDDKSGMRMDFEISIPEKIITITGEDIREREPDTY